MLRRSIEQRPEGDPRFVDVQFRDMVKDPIAQVRRVYEVAGRALEPEVEASMRAYLKASPRGKHGKHVYDLADFGLDHDERRRALSFYSERFDVPNDT